MTAQASEGAMSTDPAAKVAFPPLVSTPLKPAPPALAFGLGFRMARERLLRRRVVVLGVLGLLLSVFAAMIERRIGSAGAASRALVSTFRLVIPLTTFALMVEVSARSRLAEAASPLTRFGAPCREVVLGMLGAAVAMAAFFSAIYGTSVVVMAGAGGAMGPVLSDALLSAWIAAATSFAYAGWFAFGSTFQRSGGGRFWPLLGDFLLGGSVGLLGAITPRGNATNLLGGAAPLGLSQAASMAILLLSGAALLFGAALRSEKSP